MMSRAAEIAAETGAYATDQFNNTDMVDGYRKLGEELLVQLAGAPPISAFCSYVGTAGCFLGVSRALTAALPQLHRVVVEPPSPPSCRAVRPERTTSRAAAPAAPAAANAADYDEVLAVPEADAFAMARRAARADGIFSGPSTGANLIAPCLARRLGPGHRVVTIQVDSGLKYLSGRSTPPSDL